MTPTRPPAPPSSALAGRLTFMACAGPAATAGDLAVPVPVRPPGNGRTAAPPASGPRRFRRAACAAGMAVLLAGCASGPERSSPTLELPAAFHHQPRADETGASAPLDGWQPAPAATPAAATDWWTIYGDAELDRLLRAVGQDNPSLAQAEARYRQALARIGGERAAGRPQLSGSVSASRSGASRDGGGTSTGTRYQATLGASWVPDLWGRVAQRAQAAGADAQAVQAEHDAARLALQLVAGQGYVRLRAIDLQRALLAQAIEAYGRSLQLTRNQYEAGIVARADVIQAETQLQTLHTEVHALERQRDLEENALAWAAGGTPAQWQLADDRQALPALPSLPRALPAALLVQRPDVAAAERAVAAANARLGVARRAWLPDLTLEASGGLSGERWSRWLEAPTRVWSLGPALAASLFDGGARRAATAEAVALHDEQAAAWRSAVLLGVRETEDALASLRTLALQEAQQQRLVALAQENERVLDNRYRSGEVSYLELAVAQNLALSARREAVAVQGDRLSASMALVAALGGGWQPPDGWTDAGPAR